jgi:GT2 family glycosyltransferase
MPTVSIIMPTYNGAEHIGATVDSVLAQTLTDWELVIVDDCSRDDTRALLATFSDPRIRVVLLDENLGPVGARNRAFAETCGRYVAALDQDDLCAPTRFEKQVAFLDAHSDFVLVASEVALLENDVIRPSTLPRKLTPEMIDWLLLVRNPLVWSSVMFRADAARRLDPFERPELRYAEDFDLYQRLRAFGRLAQLHEELTVYRTHASGASKMFPEQMAANGRRILMEAHERLTGDASTEDADLLLHHIMRREPVPSMATLTELFDVIGRLYQAFVAHDALTDTGLDAVDRQVAQLWWETARAALRSGALPLRSTMAVLPREVSKRFGHRADLMVSGIVGGIRRMRA